MKRLEDLLDKLFDKLFDNKYFLIISSITMWLALVMAIRYAIS